MLEGVRSPVGQPETALLELQAKLLQAQQAVKDKDVQLARVVDKMREFKAQIAIDKKTAYDTIQQLEGKLNEATQKFEDERAQTRALSDQERKLIQTVQTLEKKFSEMNENQTKTTEEPHMFSIDDKPEFAVDESSEREEAQGTERAERGRSAEVEALKLQVENLNRQNELLALEVEEAKHSSALPAATGGLEMSDTLAKMTQERDECRGDNARLAKKVKELLKGQQNMQSLQHAVKAIEEERNSLRSEYAKAQTDWLSQEQERMESFKVMLREAEEQAARDKQKSKAEMEQLMGERQTLRSKIYQEFSDQLKAKTDLIAEFDTKLQQSQRRETDLNSKLTSARQQLQESIERGQRQLQAVHDLEREKDRLLAETHAIQSSLDTKCTQLHQQVQQLQKKLKEKENKPIDDIKVDNEDSLAALRAKYTTAKREALRLLDELAETKRKATDQQTELKLEIIKHKSALSELQKFLRLDVFSQDASVELDSQKSVQIELQGMEMDAEQFSDASQGALEERVSALLACCEQVSVSLAELQRASVQDDENGPVRVLQQAHDQLTAIKSHATAIAKCVTDLSHHFQQMEDHLSNLSARLCDEANCALGFKMILRAALKVCGASRGSSRKYKYAPLPKT